jgi:hexokinase
VKRSLEKSWPIREHLKHENAEDLFAWIGDCIAEVVEDGLQVFGEELPEELPMGVTFSFPMMYLTSLVLSVMANIVPVSITCRKPRSCQWGKDLLSHLT